MSAPPKLPPFLRLEPQFRERVWGGFRLKPDSPVPIGEMWAVHEDNAVIGMPGETLGSLTRKYPDQILGRNRQSDRFPLLIKLLDCNDWLSVQVHPDDAQAIALEGPGHVGKTEAWHVLEAKPGAELIAGVSQGVLRSQLHSAIDSGSVLQLCQRQQAQQGDTFFMPSGTMHALGPGLLIYEVQQSSDLTYRVWDWHRPAVAGRSLHIAKSKSVLGLQSVFKIRPNSGSILLSSSFFDLHLHSLVADADLTLHFPSVSVFSCVSGTVQLFAGRDELTMNAGNHCILQADRQIRGIGTAKLLIATA